MSAPIRHDHLPEQITPGERAAIAAADSRGWIVPPLYSSLRATQDRGFRTAHLRYLDRRGMIAERHRRLDGQYCYRLRAA